MGIPCAKHSQATDEVNRTHSRKDTRPRLSYGGNESRDAYRRGSYSSGSIMQKINKSAVLSAVNKSDRDHVLMMLKAGFPIDYQLTEGGWRMIHAAASIGDQEMLELLISRGADVDIPDDEEHWTPLMVATMHSQLQAVQLLIRNGASLDVEDITGRTASDLAEQYRFTQIADFLEHERRILSIRASTLES